MALTLNTGQTKNLRICLNRIWKHGTTHHEGQRTKNMIDKPVKVVPQWDSKDGQWHPINEQFHVIDASDRFVAKTGDESVATEIARSINSHPSLVNSLEDAIELVSLLNIRQIIDSGDNKAIAASGLNPRCIMDGVVKGDEPYSHPTFRAVLHKAKGKFEPTPAHDMRSQKIIELAERSTKNLIRFSRAVHSAIKGDAKLPDMDLFLEAIETCEALNSPDMERKYAAATDTKDQAT